VRVEVAPLPPARSAVDVVVSVVVLVLAVPLALVATCAGALLGLGAWAVGRLVRCRSAWWVGLLALLSVPAALTAGAALVFTSAPS